MKIYKLGEFAKLIGVSIETLRRWDRSGLLKAHRTPGNQRFYTDADYHTYMEGVNYGADD